jgi:archaemetzincin
MDEEGFERLPPPRRGEWRAVFHEEPQSFEAYAASNPLRPVQGRRTWLLQPLGDAGERYAGLLEPLRRHTEACFGVEARILPPRPLPRDSERPGRGSLHAATIVHALADRVPGDAWAVLGLTSEDLHADGLPYVFGESSLRDRAGVCSLRRHADPDPKRLLRRALNLAAHETGHLLSIRHCTAWRCLMQGANSLEEEDARPLHLCPEDLRKLEWAAGPDRRRRYEGLRGLYAELGLDAEAAWVSARLERL